MIGGVEFGEAIAFAHQHFSFLTNTFVRRRYHELAFIHNSATTAKLYIKKEEKVETPFVLYQYTAMGTRNPTSEEEDYDQRSHAGSEEDDNEGYKGINPEDNRLAKY